jgi:hypothetical protein
MIDCPHKDDCLHNAHMLVSDSVTRYSNGLITYHDVAWAIHNSQKRIERLMEYDCTLKCPQNEK